MNQNQTNLNDKPSLHWDDKYYKKVNKLITKNNDFNLSQAKSVYQKVPHFYHISWFDFLPLFIGWIHSLFNLCKTYGYIKSTSVFNKRLYHYFKQKMVIASLIHYFSCPILFLIILIFCPFLATINNSNTSATILLNAWKEVFSTFLKANSQQEAAHIFNNTIVVFFFNSKAWIITLILFFILPIFNIATVTNKLLINTYNDKWMQLIMLENELKMKLTNFEKG